MLILVKIRHFNWTLRNHINNIWPPLTSLDRARLPTSQIPKLNLLSKEHYQQKLMTSLPHNEHLANDWGKTQKTECWGNLKCNLALTMLLRYILHPFLVLYVQSTAFVTYLLRELNYGIWMLGNCAQLVRSQLWPYCLLTQAVIRCDYRKY